MKKPNTFRPRFPAFDDVFSGLSQEERQLAEDKLVQYWELLLRIGRRLDRERRGDVPSGPLTTATPESSIGSTVGHRAERPTHPSP